MEELLKEWMKMSKNAVHPGHGMDYASLVRETCEVLGLNEDDYLPRHIRNKKDDWGLE